MLQGNHLIETLGKLPTIAQSGTVFRVTFFKYALTALSSKGSLKGGRYNPPGDFEALYLADSPVNALREVEAITEIAGVLRGIPSPPRIILSVEYHLRAVLDLVNPSNATMLKTNFDELNLPWRISQGSAATQKLGAAIYHDHAQIEALIVPSAKSGQAFNLVIFPNRLLPESYVRICNPSG
jgi:RES domain-containing protein